MALAALLAGIPAAALPEGTVTALEAVTYTVEWAYYDGYAAAINVRQTPNEESLALVDALMFDPDETAMEPMSVADALAERVIGSYCEMMFSVDGGDALLPHGGGGTAAGLEITSDAFVWMPDGVSPETVDIVVSAGVRTQKEQVYDEWGEMVVPVPKADAPLVAWDTPLDLGATRVESIVVSRTPAALMLRVVHAPAAERGDPSFSVYAEDGTPMGPGSAWTEEDPETGLVTAHRSFAMEADVPAPAGLRLHYAGAPASEVALNLETGDARVIR